MKPDLLFSCSAIINSVGSAIQASNSNMKRVVFWPQSNVKLNQTQSVNLSRYVDVAHDESSILIDPQAVPNCKQQIGVLKEAGLLRQDFHDQVMIITDRLTNQIKDLNADLTISRTIIRCAEQLSVLRESWDQFEGDPMNSFTWNSSWWHAFQNKGDLHLITFERNGQIVGIAPFFLDRWFGLKRLRFLASGDTCTDYVDIICDDKHYELCAFSLAEYIREQDFDVVELECTRRDRLAERLKQHLQSGYRFDHRTAEPTWRLELPDTWDEFVSSTKRSLRRKIKKAVKRIESNQFELQSTSEGLEAEEAFDLLKSLHTRRFNSIGKPGVFADRRFYEFIRSAYLNLHSEGLSEIITASSQGMPIAAQLYFVSGDGFQLYQSGYLPEMMKTEPGHLLFTAMVKRAISRGDKCFDFLRGNESYKEFWGAKPHTQKKLRLISKRFLPTALSRAVSSVRSSCFRGSMS